MIMQKEKETIDIRDNVSPYHLKDMETLIKDFYRDVEKIKRGEL